MKTLFYSLALVAVLAFPAHGFAQAQTTAAPAQQPVAKKETITLVADGWCPYNCEPNSDRPGYMVELAKSAFARHNIDVVYSNLPWARAIEDARQNKYTGIIGAYYSDAPDFIFPKSPQGLCRFSFFVKKNDPWTFLDMSSLKTRSLGAINDYSYSVELDDYVVTNRNNLQRLQILSGDNALDNNIKKLLMGRVDTIIEDKQVFGYFLSPAEYEQVRMSIKDAGTLPDKEDGNGIIFIAFSPKNPNSPRYAKILSDETELMRKSGELQQILSKYGIADFADQIQK